MKPSRDLPADQPVPPLMRAFFGCQRQIMATVGADIAGQGLAREEFDVLAALGASTGMPCKELAGRVMKPNPTLTRTLARMEAQGLVQTVRGAEDGRQKLVSLSAAGQAAYARVIPAHLARVARATDHLTAPEQVELARLLHKLAAGFAAEHPTP